MTKAMRWMYWFVMTWVVIALGTLFYLAFVDRVVTLDSQRLVSIEVTNEGGHGTFIITREFCSAADVDAHALRVFRKVPAPPNALEEVVELGPTPIHLLKGCHRRPRIVLVPEIVTAGEYVYESGLRFCNELRCKTFWMPPTLIRVDSFQGGRHALQFRELDQRPEPPRPPTAP